jgi:hypothetical protein
MSKTKAPVVSVLPTGLEAIKKENLSNMDFNIQKAEVLIVSNGNKQQFIATVKYKVPDQWLISLKGTTGIEAARAYINSDTILVNERLHKKLYYNKSRILEEKFGITFKALPVMFGDLIESERTARDSIKCYEGKSIKKIRLDRNDIEYIINCMDNKTIKCTISGTEKGEIKFIYSKVKVIGNNKLPEKIIIKGEEEKNIIEIIIRKIDFSPIEKIDFISGKGYEKMLLK